MSGRRTARSSSRRNARGAGGRGRAQSCRFSRVNYSSSRRGLSLSRRRGTHRGRQDAAGRTAGRAARGHRHPGRRREPVPGGFLRRAPGRGAAGAAVLPAQPPPPADAAAPGRPVPADDDLRLRLRQGQDLRLPEPRRQRAVHLPAAVRPAGEGRAAARPGRLPPGAHRPARPAAEGAGGLGRRRRAGRVPHPMPSTCAS